MTHSPWRVAALALGLLLPVLFVRACTLSVEGAGKPPEAQMPLSDGGAIIVLDLSALPPTVERKTFTLRVNMTGLVRQSFVPFGRTTFQLTPGLTLLD